MRTRALRRRDWRILPAIALALLTGAGCGVAPFAWFRGGHGGEAPVSESSRSGGSAAAPGDSAAPPAGSDPTAAQAGAVDRAAALEAEGSFAAAESSLAVALAADPTDPAALSLQSKLDWRSGRHAEAVERLARARAAIDPFPPALSAALALHLAALGRGAESASAGATLEAPGTDWGTLGSALVYLRLRGEGFAAAGEAARHAARANPASAANHNNLGIALLYEGKPDSARAELLRASEIDPRLPGPFYNLAIVEKFYLRDDAAARGWYQRYRALSDEDPDGVGAALEEAQSAEPVATRNTEGSKK